MNNLNLDTTRQHETVFNRMMSPMTPQEQCFSPIPKDHRREKSDSFCMDGSKSDSEEDSFLMDSPNQAVNEHSFDLQVMDIQRNRSQSQVDPSLLIGASVPTAAYQERIVLDLDDPHAVLEWFTLRVGL